MHMEMRVFEAANFKFEAKFAFWGLKHWCSLVWRAIALLFLVLVIKPGRLLNRLYLRSACLFYKQSALYTMQEDDSDPTPGLVALAYFKMKEHFEEVPDDIAKTVSYN